MALPVTIERQALSSEEALSPRPHLAIIGASGRVGRRLQHFLAPEYDVTVSKHVSEITEPDTLSDLITDFDVTNLDTVKSAVERMAANGARTVINCSGILSVDKSESTRGDKDSPMYKVHVVGAENVANVCRSVGLKLIHIGTEYEFRGDKLFREVYNEDELPDLTDSNPTWYGLTKAVGGQKVLEIYPEGSVLVRFSQVQSPAGGLFLATLRALTQENPRKFTRSNDQYVSPITDSTATEAIKLIEDALHKGIAAPVYHVSATDRYTSYVTCLKLAKEFGLADKALELIDPVTLDYLVNVTREQGVVRPRNSILGVEQFVKDFRTGILGTVEQEIRLFKSMYGSSVK